MAKIKNLKKRVFTFDMSDVAFIILCGYTVLHTLVYTKWFPEIFVSLALYGFIVVAAVAVMLKRYMRIASYVKWYGAFCLFCIVSCIYSPDKLLAFASAVDVCKTLIYLIMFISIISTQKRINIYMAIISISSSVLIIYLMMTNQLIVDERLGQSLTGNTNIFASLIMVGAIGAIHSLLVSNNIVFKLLSMLMMAIQEYALALSGGRKFFLIPILLISFIIIMRDDKKGRKKILRNILIVCGFLYIVYWVTFNVPEIYNRVGVRLEGLINTYMNVGTTEASAVIRREMIACGIQGWKMSPLWGYGINSFVVNNSFGAYAHNNFVELLYGVGLIGFSLYYLNLLLVGKRLVFSTQMSNKKCYWLALFFCLLIFEYGAVTYNDSIIQSLYALIYLTFSVGENKMNTGASNSNEYLV